MLYRFLRFISYPFIALLYPTKVICKGNFPTKSAVVCCNHYASSDVIIVASKLFKKECNVVSKAELFKKKISAWFLRKMGAIPVTRGSTELSAHKGILRRLKKGKQLLIFPEGTRNKAGTHDMADFKSGASLYAIKAKVPVVPLLFHHQSKKFRRNYLIVGEPIDLSAFYDTNVHDVKEEATKYIYQKMQALQAELDGYVLAANSRKSK